MLQNKYCLLLAFFAFQFISAQVKIGSNPNSIDAGSIIELESNNKALVLTRLTTTQMVGLAPLRGAVVYNIDTQCVHFYDSAQWVNLCSATNTTGFSFTDNSDGTITLSNDSGGTLTFNGDPETVSTLVDNSDGTYTYTDENGTQTSITSSSNQNLNTDGTPGNIGIASGNSITLNVDDADADDQNEIQDLQFSGGLISLTNDPDATIIDLSGFDSDSNDDFSGVFGDLTGIPTNLSPMIANTSGINTGDQDISGIATNATDIDALEAEQITQNDAIAINTAKTGITTAQADIIANTSGVNTGNQDISGIATNATDIDTLEAEQIIQNDAIAVNTSKTGITTAQADIIANTSGINTGDQDISGIATNATEIDALEAEQITQNEAIAINTSKTGITTAQADIIANTSGINTGDQNIDGITDNATDIDALEAEQVTQNDAIAVNTLKIGITTVQADIIANTSGINTGDQDISGIGTNATNITTNILDIDALETEQVTQNDAIALNTAKAGITTAQASVIANTSGTNTGDQEIIGAETNNAISVGANGGAFYESPIKAFGKITAAGGIAKATAGITVTKLGGNGLYQVNLPSGLVSDANYIIQLSQPGRGGVGNDDPGISYENQTTASFQVIVGDNDNGGTDRSRFDSEFMFTILDL